MKFKPHFYFWTTAILILIIGLITYDQESVLDINLHDTYYVIQHFIIIQCISLLLILVGGLYWIYEKANRKLNKLLTKIHIITTIGGILIYPVIEKLLRLYEVNQHTTIITNLAIITLMVLIAQVLFLINLLIGLFTRNK